MGIKKSNFIAVTEIPDGAYLDFVSSGTNYRISKADFITALGATGTIEQAGDETGVPVLDIDSTVYKIRNIEAGSGINASTSALNGIALSFKAASGTVGDAIFTVEDDGTYTFSSLEAGNGIIITDNEGSLEIEATEITIENRVVVNSISDFPDSVSGVITLLASTEYLISGGIETENRFVGQDGTVIAGLDSEIAHLIHTGTDALFTSTGNIFTVRDIEIGAPAGSLFDLGSGSVTRFRNGKVLSCDTLGVCASVELFQIDDCFIAGVASGGVSFTGIDSILTIDKSTMFITSGTFVDFGTATFNTIRLSNNVGSIPSGAIGLSGAADSANINTDGIAIVENNNFTGSGTLVSGISTTDALWEFKTNSRIPDSKTRLLATNAGVTLTIVAIDTPVIIGATWVTVDESRFESDGSGSFTYIGSGENVSLTASITADIASGIDDCTFYYAKNGTVIAESGILREIDGGDPGNVSLPWAMDLVTGDTIEIYAENNAATVNIIIESAILRVD